MIVVGYFLPVVLWFTNASTGIIFRSRHDRSRLAPLLLRANGASRESWYNSIGLPPTPKECSPPKQRQNKSRTTSAGVTAVLELPSDLLVVAGTSESNEASRRSLVLVGDKRGQVRILQLDVVESDGVRGKVVEATWISTLIHSASSTLPVFSLAVAHQETANILVGGGDRYISIWKQHRDDRADSRIVWNRVQRLGPHTGWVKAIAAFSFFDEPRAFSIGCNRVVTWKHCVDAIAWRDLETVAVDSNPDAAACTLSSDLLCLALCKCSSTAALSSSVDILAVGGVDGRIHFFWITSNESGRMEPAGVISAHKGRVNALYFEAEHQFLFSVSHDGATHCWSLGVEHSNRDACGTSSLSLSVSLQATHRIKDDANGSRITALVSWQNCSTGTVQRPL